MPASKKARVFFGNAEDQDRQHINDISSSKQQEVGPHTGISPAIAAGIKAGNINISDGNDNEAETDMIVLMQSSRSRRKRS